MEDSDLRHICHLSSIAVAMVRDPDFVDVLRDGQDQSEAKNTATCLRILADAFVELMNRCDMKPRFRAYVEGR